MGSRAGNKGHKDGWKMFTGDDVCYPVEVFLHTMELKAEREGPTTLRSAVHTKKIPTKYAQILIIHLMID